MSIPEKSHASVHPRAGLLALTMFGTLMAPIHAKAASAPSSPAERQPTATAALALRVADAIRNDPALSAPIRGSITLYDTGAAIPSLADVEGAGAARITWRSSAPAILSDTDRRNGADVVRKGVVTRGSRDRAVTLTATITVPGSKPIRVPLKLSVLHRATLSAMNAYMFVYFTGNSEDGEKLRFATSDGNNALEWKLLNDGQPVLTSSKGTRGLRDPFIMRSVEGDRFFLLATDLSAARTGWTHATDQGSHYLEIWESTDLVHWGKQRHVKVSQPTAGMTWAPEASYDPTIGAYVVYWTSTLFADAAHTRPDGNGPQILTSITRDFRSFTPPRPWFKAADLPELVKDRGMIDTTVMRVDNAFYRFTKATQAQGCPSADIIGQRSTSLRASMASGAWSMVSRCIGRHAGTPEVEGPSAFPANPGDTSGFRYFLWVDNYGGIGYIPLATSSLAGDVHWTYPQTFHLPPSPRHGTVMSITAAERDRLAAQWNPALLVTSVTPVALSAPSASHIPPLLQTVTAQFKDGHSEQVAVRWHLPNASQLARARSPIRIEGQLANSAATPATATIAIRAPQ
ncbi:glycoside hydrolase family 43 protein [Novosphingobium sp. 9]|uniref:glycoside hydrolase family 43 protein n=1 Tax=Novosphingobium sp. 9 TaxID=2025349 RepID=UPI0021B64625|nr:glycoside hydrolase family 43 protein [Novosphingobium sp. 9]